MAANLASRLLRLAVVCVLITGVFSGCSDSILRSPSQPPQTHNPLTPSDSAAPVEATDASDIEDDGAWGMVLGLIDVSSDKKKAFKENGIALIDSAAWEDMGNRLTLMIDRVEPTGKGGEEPRFTNREVKLEKLEMSFPVILVDPHNYFKPILGKTFAAMIKDYYDTPFFIYSLDGEPVMLVEMMLP
ncbi:MAG: hypothetical protein LBI99_05390 [Propionibacteriaceae bacterium]|jgi:hypothetical protein|nr:hypothetical protein [Propionibacteriaceae bacterium]